MELKIKITGFELDKFGLTPGRVCFFRSARRIGAAPGRRNLGPRRGLPFLFTGPSANLGRRPCKDLSFRRGWGFVLIKKLKVQSIFDTLYIYIFFYKAPAIVSKLSRFTKEPSSPRAQAPFLNSIGENKDQ